MIEAEGLTKHFGRKLAVEGLSLTVPPGQIHGLLGPNGAGKTTTVRLLASLLRPNSGRATVAGYDVIAEPQEVRRRIGILTEVPGLYERLTALEYLEFFGQIYEVSSPYRAKRIRELLERFDLWEARGDRLRSYSKGMKQKMAIARAILHDPEVLFFDEPTTNLDPEAARKVRDHIRMLAAERGRTVLLCTHNLSEAEELCSKISILQQGRRVAEGTPAQLRAAMGQRMRLRLTSVNPDYVAALRQVPGVEALECTDGTIEYKAGSPEEVNPKVVMAAVAMGAQVVALETEPVPLEEAYLRLIRSKGNADGTGHHPEGDEGGP